jgi:osmoprotectant transport system ATP-binding protein
MASSAAFAAASAARSLRNDPFGARGSSLSGPSASSSRAISAPMVEHWLRLRRSYGLASACSRTVGMYSRRRFRSSIFQGAGLFPHMTLAENVAVTPRLLGWPKDEIAARVAELMELVELPVWTWGDRSPASLSGGQRQRVAFARALAARPSLVLLDEPFGALDAISRDGIAEAYRRLHDNLNLTTVMVTHDVNEALLMADRLGVMREGRLVASGPPAGLLEEGGDPYVRDLLDAPRRQVARIAAKFGETAHG